MADNHLRGSVPAPESNAKQQSGPRSLLLERCELGFGFTLRHFIVYPPESATLLGGCLSRAMDTIFVKRVAPRSPAWRAGLCTGDRLVSVNGADVGGMAYAAVVQLIQASPAQLHLVVVPKEHDILQLYFGETAHNPETNQRHGGAGGAGRRKSPENLRLSAIPARVQGVTKAKQRLSSNADPARLSLDDSAETRPVSDHRRSSDGNRRDAVYGNVAWGKPLGSPGSDADAASLDSRHDSLDSRLADSKDSLSSADSVSTLTGGDDDSVIMSRIRRSTEQKEEFLRRPVAAVAHADRLLAREFYARPQKLKPVWPPTQPEVARPAEKSAPRRSEPRSLGRARDEPTSGSENGDGADRSSASPNDERHSVPLVQLVSRRARQFERGVDGERTPLYASELARLTSKRANPGVALRRREIERRSTRELPELLEPCPESPPILAGNQLTPLTTRIHCDPPQASTNHDQASPQPTNQHLVFAQRVNHANPLRVKTEDAFLRARSNSAESWAAAFPPPRSSLLSCDWPIGAGIESEEARHKVVRQDSYLAAVRTPVPSADLVATLDCAAPTATPAPRPSLLPLSPLPHLPSSPLTHTTTQQLISALDAAQGQAAGDITTTVVRRQKNNHHAQTDEERLRRASYLRATNSEQTQLEHEIEQEESEQRRESQPAMIPTTEPEKENLPALREGWLNCKITIVDGKRCSDRSWKQVWAVLQASRTLMLYKDAPGQSGADNESSALDVRGCHVDAGAVVSSRKKHVLRVNTLSGSELLAQAADSADSEMWASALGQEPPTSPTTCISPTSKSRKLPAFRSRSPTGQSPASKSAKGQLDPSLAGSGGAKPAKADAAPGSPALKGPKGQSDSAGGGFKQGKATVAGSDATKPRGDPTSSPKSSTWKGRVARQLRRMQGAPSATSPGSGPAGEGFTIGASLQDCASSDENPFVPMLVTKCASVVEDRGLDIVGIYRVPGNTAAVHSLTEAVNKGFMFANCQQDPRWTDVNVISSLLKLFFRKLPDALLTTELYPLFIDADKMDDPNLRIVTMRRLVRELPDHHYETLKFLCLHLKRVVAHAAANKMEARNLAIVFGPTLVRTADNNMITMVTDMSHQCRIVESLLLHVDWFFSPDSSETLELPEAGTVELEPSAMSHDLLLGNIQKVEGMRGASGGESVLAKVIGSSIISAANRKMQRKPRKSGNGGGGGAEEPREVSIDSAVRRHQEEVDARQAAAAEPEEEPTAAPIDEQPALASAQDRLAPQPEDDGSAKATDAMGWTYAGLSATTQERIRRFEQETKAMLQRDTSWAARRETEPPPNTRVSSVSRTTTTHSSESRVSVTNIHVNPLASVENTELVTKRHQHEETQIRGDSGEVTGIALVDPDNGNLKRFKTGNEQPCEPLRLMSSLRCASLDSLHDAFDRPPSELSDDGSDLLSSLTSTFDRKLKSLLGTTTTATTTLTSSSVTLPSPIRLSPVNLASLASHLVTLTSSSVTLPSKVTRDEDPVAVISGVETSPVASTLTSATLAPSTLAPSTLVPSTLVQVPVVTSTLTSPLVTTTKQRSKIPMFRDPSLHRQTTEKEKEAVRRRWLGQDADVSPSPNSSPSHTPRPEPPQDGNDCPAPNPSPTPNNSSPAPNNPSPATNEAVLRSNLRPTTKVRRADSLSKTEKTESNRRRQEKENVKLKRRHGAKDGSIKRRHTVGGTKDLATLPWLDNRWAGEEGKERRGLRTSSPDLGRVDWREWGAMEVGKKGGVLESHV